jgi:hypothetical protein
MFNHTLISMIVQVALLFTVAGSLHTCMNRQVRVRRILWRDGAPGPQPQLRLPLPRQCNPGTCHRRRPSSLAASVTEGNNGTALNPAASRVPPCPDGTPTTAPRRRLPPRRLPPDPPHVATARTLAALSEGGARGGSRPATSD